MSKSARFIIGALVFLLSFILITIKFQAGQMPMTPDSLHEKLVNTTRDMQWLSLVNHIIFILVLCSSFVLNKSRNIIIPTFMIYLCVGVFASTFKHNIFINYFYFPLLIGLILHAFLTKKLNFNYSALKTQDKIFGILAILGSLWYLALVDSPVPVNALLYSPVGVVNCPTTLALCGFLILNTNRSLFLELAVICGAIFFGGLGILTMSVYYDILLVSMGLFLAWRLWKDDFASTVIS